MKRQTKKQLTFFRAPHAVFCASCGRHIEWDKLTQHPVPQFATGACCTKSCENWGITVKVPFEYIQCQVIPRKTRTIRDAVPEAVKSDPPPVDTPDTMQ